MITLKDKPWWFLVIRDLGFPIAAFLALGYVTVRYFIEPAQSERSKLIEATVLVQENMAKTLDRMSNAQSLLVDTQTNLINSVEQTTKLVMSNAELIKEDKKKSEEIVTLMQDAKDVMSSSLPLREEQTEILKQIRDQLKRP